MNWICFPLSFASWINFSYSSCESCLKASFSLSRELTSSSMDGFHSSQFFFTSCAEMILVWSSSSSSWSSIWTIVLRDLRTSISRRFRVIVQHDCRFACNEISNFLLDLISLNLLFSFFVFLFNLQTPHCSLSSKPPSYGQRVDGFLLDGQPLPFIWNGRCFSHEASGEARSFAWRLDIVTMVLWCWGEVVDHFWRWFKTSSLPSPLSDEDLRIKRWDLQCLPCSFGSQEFIDVSHGPGPFVMPLARIEEKPSDLSLDGFDGRFCPAIALRGIPRSASHSNGSGFAPSTKWCRELMSLVCMYVMNMVSISAESDYHLHSCFSNQLGVLWSERNRQPEVLEAVAFFLSLKFFLHHFWKLLFFDFFLFLLEVRSRWLSLSLRRITPILLLFIFIFLPHLNFWGFFFLPFQRNFLVTLERPLGAARVRAPTRAYLACKPPRSLAGISGPAVSKESTPAWGCLTRRWGACCWWVIWHV